MTTEVKHSGSWRAITDIEVKHSGSWRDIQTVEAKHSGVWRTVFQALSALFNTNGDLNFRLGATCYAGIQINANGFEYEYTNTGSASSIGTWLNAGLNSEVWVRMDVTSGSWNSLNAGTATRLQCNTTRSWRILQSSTGTRTVQCQLRFYDAAVGGNLLDDTGTITFSAEYGV